MAEWRRHPREYFEGSAREQAVADLKEYQRRCEGFNFNRLADRNHPDEFTCCDFVAVSMLSVNVPAAAALRILEEDDHQITDLLKAIPMDLHIWDDGANIVKGSPAWDLWELIDDNTGIGATITSKLMAAKRPHLVPIYDSVVSAALFQGKRIVTEYWQLWRDELSGTDGEALRSTVEQVRDEVGYDPELFSILRVIDIVVWMQGNTTA